MKLNNKNNIEEALGAVDTHWQAFNDLQGEGAGMILSGNFDYTDYEELMTNLIGQLTNQNQQSNQHYLLMGERNSLRRLLINDMSSYRYEIKYLTPLVGNEGFDWSLPELPDYSSKAARFINAAERIANQWEALISLGNPAVPNPLVLANGTTLAQFNTRLATFRTNMEALTGMRHSLKNTILVRRQLVKTAAKRIVEYRGRVIKILGRNHHLSQSLPIINRNTGSAPDAVAVKAHWDDNAKKVVLEWTASTHPKLAGYIVRACLDSPYRTDYDMTVVSLDKSVQAYSTNFGLSAPGSSVLFRVFAVTETGREKGSKTVAAVHEVPAPIES